MAFPQTTEALREFIVETMASQAAAAQPSPMPQEEIAEAREAVARATAAVNLFGTQQAVMAKSE